jgi:CheY-like chemotaxis protein
MRESCKAVCCLQKIPPIDIEVLSIHGMQVQSKSRNEQGKKLLSILIVDDEPDILKIFKKSIEMSGHSSYGFVNPSAALEHFRQNPKAYDVIISDIRMPKLSGFELVREIRNLNGNVRIVLMTSFEISMEEFQKVMPSLKIDALVEKSTSLAKLREIIELPTGK